MSEIANSSLDTAVQENTTGVAPVISTPPSGPSIDTTASQAPIAPEDPENHLLDLWMKILPLEKQALMLRRTGFSQE
jgi:hypothetical protein